MSFYKIIKIILKYKISHYGVIYRLVSLYWFFRKIHFNNEFDLLDIGFNDGIFREYFINRFPNCNYSGVEIDEKYLKIYKNTFYHDFENSKLDRTYNLLFCSHVLEHIENDKDFIENITNSFKDDQSKLIIRVPMPSDMHSFLRRLNYRLEDHHEHERDGYTLDDMKALLRTCNLKIDSYYFSMGPLGIFVHNIFEILRDYEVRFQRLLTLPYIIITFLDLFFINKNSRCNDLTVFVIKDKSVKPI